MLARFFSSESPILICTASHAETDLLLKATGNENCKVPGEWQTINFDFFSLLRTGVGKANAAGATAAELSRASERGHQYRAVLLIGIGGALAADLPLGSAVLADCCIFADEGTVLNSKESSWRSLEEAGFAQISFPVKKTEWWLELAKIVDRVGTIATVSTISGRESVARAYTERSKSVVEAMEGAAIAQSCIRYGIDFAELRSISNLCGNSNREENPWDIGKSFKRLDKLIKTMLLKAD